MKVMDASELYDPEFRKLIKSKKPTVIIPVGSLEQHGAHLPITTDSDIVTEIASRLAKKDNFIALPMPLLPPIIIIFFMLLVVGLLNVIQCFV